MHYHLLYPVSTPILSGAVWTGVTFCDRLAVAFEQTVFWKRNVFELPSGQEGKKFVSEKARLFAAMTPENPLECVAMKTVAIMEHLLLQKPSVSAKQSN